MIWLLITLLIGPLEPTPPDSLIRAVEMLRTTDRATWLRLPTLSPVPNPHPTSVFQPDRTHPVTGQSRPHFGVDLRAPIGTPVRAAGDARVLARTRTPSYGLVVDLDHGNGYITRYGHLSEVYVEPGDLVRRGDRIARSGNTGLTTGPNLHYEVYREGWQVDPCPFLIYPSQADDPSPVNCSTPE